MYNGGLPYHGRGLMYAYEPWSGHYTVNFPIWTSAHTCQFSEPGWIYLAIHNNQSTSTTGSGSGYLPEGGSYITLVPPSSKTSSNPLGKNTVATAGAGDFSLVIEKLEGNCSSCKIGPTTAETVQFKLTGGLGGFGNSELEMQPMSDGVQELSFWCTNNQTGFQQMKNVPVDSSGQFSVSVPRDTVCTVSTLTGQAKGQHPPPPDSKPFPLPYKDDFDTGNPLSEQPLYFTDQGGSFLIAAADEGFPSSGKLLKQVWPCGFRSLLIDRYCRSRLCLACHILHRTKVNFGLSIHRNFYCTETRSLVAVEPRRPPMTDVGTETTFRLDQHKHFQKK